MVYTFLWFASLYMFILCSEVLSTMIQKAIEIVVIKGLKLALSAIPVLHLFFVDDTLFSFQFDVVSC